MPLSGIEHNPFEEHISGDEVLLWVSRSDKMAYMKKQWRHFRAGIVIGSIVAIASTLGEIYPSSRFQEAFCIFMLLVLPIILAMGIYFVLDSYRYAPWYGLTNMRLFVANLEEGSFVVRATDFSNIKSISVKEIYPDVGTVCCVCYSVISTHTDKNVGLENIRSPNAIVELIQKHSAIAHLQIRG